MTRRIFHFITSLFSPKYRIAAHAYKMKFVGEKEISLLKDLCDTTKVSIDVGANNGSYSYWLEKYSNKVIAFEPQLSLADILKKGLKNTVVHNCGLLDQKECLPINIPKSNGFIVTGEASLTEPVGVDYLVEHVRIETLDSFDLTNIGFIKIDVEGHELAVIQGSLGTLERNRPNLIVEIEARHSKVGVAETIKFIEEIGYVTYVYANQKLELYTPQRPCSNNNFIFLPANK